MKNSPVILTLLLLIFAGKANSQTVSFDGQVIAWTTINPASPFQIQAGTRFIPEFKFDVPLKKLSLEGEFSGNIWGAYTSYPGKDSLDYELSPYRAWIKLSGEQFEIRAGLQKINFGSASMFRPLMWFDSMDPRDPLQLTDGVYSLLGRYYFLNNANIWLWTLYGNNKLKGFEFVTTSKNTIEYGGRIQVPVFIGEAAISYHHREMDFPGWENNQPENRYAFDTKIDLGVGLWFEGSLAQKKNPDSEKVNTLFFNGGTDYTFNIGNGLNVTAEYFHAIAETPNPILPGETSEVEMGFGGLSLNYPVTIIHNVSAVVFYNFKTRDLYRFINWSMIYDNWTFYVMGFWNPETYILPGFQQEANLFSGAGAQLMAVFNF